MFTSQKGTNIIYSGPFETQSGQAVTGTIDMRYKEANKKSEVIYNALSTHTDDGFLLHSDGMFSIYFYKGENRVYPTSQVFINVPSSGTVNPNMALYRRVFYGYIYPNANINTPWSAGADDDTTCSSVGISSNIYIIRYCFNPFLDWVNLDVPIYPQPLTRITVNVTGQLDTVISYLVLDDYNSVTSLKKDTIDYVYYRDNVPVGQNIKVMIMGNKNGVAYFDKFLGVVTDNMVINVTPVTISQSDLVHEIQSLDD
jgi:hypothetical protein